MEQLQKVIQTYRFLSMTGLFLCVCTVVLTIFYFVKQDVKKAVGILSGSIAKKEIHHLELANMQKEENLNQSKWIKEKKFEESSDMTLLQHGTTELLQEEGGALKVSFVITRQIVYIHTMEDIEGGSKSYEGEVSVII